MKKFIPLVLIVVLMGVSSCATIISGSKAKVTLNGSSNEAVTVNTDVQNYYNVRFPAKVKVKRKGGTSRITVQGNEYDYKDVVVNKSFNGTTLWNILLGGLIGIGIDAASGGIYKPDQKSYFVESTKKNVAQKPELPQPGNPERIIEALSDVDLNIPTSKTSNDNTFAVIIANEKYQDEAEVKFASRDGLSFKMYCEKTLGIPSRNIHYRENATRNHIIAEMDWLKKVCDVYNGSAKVIFYYAGHGIPDESNKEAYLLPIDGIGNNVMTGYKLSELYGNLSRLKTDKAMAFLDACFSGSQRNGKALTSARGVAISTKKEVPTGKVIALTAAQGDETAYPYEEKGHGLFTYFLLKKLQESNGECTIKELGDYVKENVSRHSVVVNGKNQTPAILSSVSLGDSWKKVTLK